jgi:hypothetical protein
MKRKNGYFIFVFIIIFLILVFGYALYGYPKNYEVLEIKAKNDNYSVVGLFVGSIALTMSLISFIVFKKSQYRLFISVELIASILLLILWKGCI